MGLMFEWDAEKAETNRRKHDVDFAEAATVFHDTLSSTIPDPDHATPSEDRELTIGLSHRQRLEKTKSFLKEFGFGTLPLSENIGHRAAVYIEEYGRSYGLRAGDAIVAATAAEHGLTLCTGNAKHFNPIRDLKTRIFKP